MIISVKDYVNVELTEAVSRAKSKYMASALPIYRSNDGVPEQIGTCFIISIDKKHYLVTAAHILDHTPNSALYLGSIGDLKSIEGDFHVTVAPGGDRRKDHYDFAWLYLDNSFDRVLDNITVIQQEQISHNRIDPTGRVYLAIGYPNSKNKRVDHRARSIAPRRATYYATHSSKPDLLKALKISGNDHLVVEYKNKSFNEQYDVVNSLQLTGMSGGPLFDLGRVILRNSPAPPLLSGMIIEHHKAHSAVLSVKIDLIINKIRSNGNAV